MQLNGVDPLRVVTLQNLRELGACASARDWFRREFHTGSGDINEVFQRVIDQAFEKEEADTNWIFWYLDQVDGEMFNKLEEISGSSNRTITKEDYQRAVNELFPVAA